MKLRMKAAATTAAATWLAYRMKQEGVSRSLHNVVGKPMTILVPQVGSWIVDRTDESTLRPVSSRKAKQSLVSLIDLIESNVDTMDLMVYGRRKGGY